MIEIEGSSYKELNDVITVRHKNMSAVRYVSLVVAKKRIVYPDIPDEIYPNQIPQYTKNILRYIFPKECTTDDAAIACGTRLRDYMGYGRYEGVSFNMNFRYNFLTSDYAIITVGTIGDYYKKGDEDEFWLKRKINIIWEPESPFVTKKFKGEDEIYITNKPGTYYMKLDITEITGYHYVKETGLYIIVKEHIAKYLKKVDPIKVGRFEYTTTSYAISMSNKKYPVKIHFNCVAEGKDDIFAFPVCYYIPNYAAGYFLLCSKSPFKIKWRWTQYDDDDDDTNNLTGTDFYSYDDETCSNPDFFQGEKYYAGFFKPPVNRKYSYDGEIPERFLKITEDARGGVVYQGAPVKDGHYIQNENYIPQITFMNYAMEEVLRQLFGFIK